MDDITEKEYGFRRVKLPDLEDNRLIRDLDGRLNGMRTCYNLLRQHGADLQYAVTDFENAVTGAGNFDKSFADLSRNISDKATLFGIAANAMIRSCDGYISSAESEAAILIKSLSNEKQRTKQLEIMVQDVAKEQTILEKTTNRISRIVTLPILNDSKSMTDLREEQKPTPVENYDIYETDSLAFIRSSIRAKPNVSSHNHIKKLLDSFEKERRKKNEKKRLRQIQKRQEREAVEIEEQASSTDLLPSLSMDPESTPKRRRSIVPNRPDIPFSAWSVLKNSIGKDLSKIPMPVNFNEPITVLQRITEELEYAFLLDIAADTEDLCQQIAHVAAFSISGFAPIAVRSTKPFNPLLGETYEFDRTDDRGWRSIAEQVSHHPPISSQYCEGRGWNFWQDFGLTSKLRGKTVQARPTGKSNCKFHKTDSTYTWNKPSTIVHNIIFGTMWMDQTGTVNINGSGTAAGLTCDLTYVPYSVFSPDLQRRVNGVVKDQDGVAKYVIKAYWDHKVEMAEVLNPKIKNDNTYETGPFTIIWKKDDLEPETNEYHNFSKFTCELNELEAGIAPTDSRLRPDVRLMEEGYWDESNAEKLRLEQKQRDVRKSRQHDASADDLPHPVWFNCTKNGEKFIFEYKGTYWKAKEDQDWSMCPQIF